MLKYFAAFLALALALALAFAQIALADDTNKRVVCYFDSDHFLTRGAGNFTQYNLKFALPSCTHLVYGYAGITRASRVLFKLNDRRLKLHYADITVMKKKYPHLKIYLSVGGDRDVDSIDVEKYINFLKDWKHFIEHSIQFLEEHRFDGLDLAFQFPRTEATMADHEIDSLKQRFTAFVGALHAKYAKRKIPLSLTVLPNVNSTHYLDIPNIYDKFDFINLFAFDFNTPERNPNAADYTAPIHMEKIQNRLPYKNVDFQVNYWIENGCPADKLNLGVPTHARTWKITEDSESLGPGAAGGHTKKEGLLSYAEVCSKQSLIEVIYHKGYGSYAVRTDDSESKKYTFIGYDSLEYVAEKAKYAKRMGLGGVAIVDLTYDDFKGVCEQVKYPILKTITKNLLN